MAQSMNQATHIGIGIDCGTSGIRAVALSCDGILLAKSDAPLTEQSPDHWWQTTLGVLDQLFSQLALIHRLDECQFSMSVDATSSTLLIVDALGVPISPVLMYYDACPESAAHIKHRLAASSGAHGSQSSLAKVVHLISESNQLNQSQLNTWMVCHQADWLVFNLSGRLGVSDYNNCLKLGYDPIQQEWEVCTQEVVGKEHLPEVFEPATPIGHLISTLSSRWQLSNKVLICTGTTDSIAAFVASGANQAGDAVVSLGSTLAFKLLSNSPHVNADNGVYSHRLWQQWLVSGASNAGGLCLSERFDLPNLTRLGKDMIKAAPLFTDCYPLPKYRVGERFPINDQNKRATDLPEHLSDREVFACLVYGLVSLEDQSWQLLSSQCQQPIKRLFACGGGNKNPAWTALRKTRLAYSHQTPWSEDAAIGSALIALKGLASITGMQTS
jgi:sugar (pentulose or hexulose) kinase